MLGSLEMTRDAFVSAVTRKDPGDYTLNVVVVRLLAIALTVSRWRTNPVRSQGLPVPNHYRTWPLIESDVEVSGVPRYLRFAVCHKAVSVTDEETFPVGTALAGNAHVKETIAHAKEAVAHEKEAITHLEEAVKSSTDAHAKEALEHAKEAVKHAEEALAHAEQAEKPAKGKKSKSFARTGSRHRVPVMISAARPVQSGRADPLTPLLSDILSTGSDAPHQVSLQGVSIFCCIDVHRLAGVGGQGLSGWLQ